MNQTRMQNMYQQVKYEKLHISAKITEIKLMKFQQLKIHKLYTKPLYKS